MTEMEAAVGRIEAEDGKDDGITEFDYVEYKLDGRGQPVVDEDGKEVVLEKFTFRAEIPNEGQLVFLLSAMGRGQTGTQRVASVVNFLHAVLDQDSKDYLDTRLLSRENTFPPGGIEKVFKAFTEEWFGRPTQ